MKRLLMCVAITLLCVVIPPLALAQGGKEVKGVVVDAEGLPILGATVAEVGTLNGTMTDIQGQFVLTVKGDNSVVEISFIGYKTVHLAANSTELSRVTLHEDAMGLEEVVVIGYGTVKKNDMTGSVIAVKAEELNRGALTSPQELLRGKVPGVNIVSGNGAPGAGAEIRIRGGASWKHLKEIPNSPPAADRWFWRSLTVSVLANTPTAMAFCWPIRPNSTV